jgi:hypothetical protein
MRIRLAATIIFYFILLRVQAQPADSLSVQQLPSNYLDKVSSKAKQVEQKVDRKADKVLQAMLSQEAKMKKKLVKIDSLKAKEIFGNAEQKYKDLQGHLQSGILSKNYIASLDTLNTSLKFLQQNQQLLSKTKEVQQKLKDALGKVNGLENQFQKAEEIKKFLKERKEFLKEQLGNFGFAKELKKLNKQMYYYSQQLNEYKALLKDHKKAERKAIELLSKTKLFKDFMRKNSMLASLFRLPGDPNDPAGQVSLVGLQTRAQVNNLIQQQITAGGSNAQAQFRQNMQEAQSKMNELKNKLNQLGSGSNDMEMPEGFKPNNQKTKSFLKRLEYGTNMQTQKATNFFPVTSDIGLSIGYRLNGKSVIGVGASYKVGMGRGWNHIRITHEGIGLRTYADVKLKGSFWLSGGYEQNYKTAFNDFSQLRDRSAWQASGLFGLSKIIALKTKFLKKTKLSLLWDFMSYNQVPKTQPVIFRIGYSIK